MGFITKISWTDSSRNFWFGCSKVFVIDPVTGKVDVLLGACVGCYVERDSRHYRFNFDEIKQLNFANAESDLMSWPPRKIFIEDFGDLFHEAISFEKIDEVMAILVRVDKHHKEKYGQVHQYQILTKRPHRMEDYFSTRQVPRNMLLGVSIGNKASLKYLVHLRRINAYIKWISFEPLVQDIEDGDHAYRDNRFIDAKYVSQYENVFDEDGLVNLAGIDWIVIGGESGRGNIINTVKIPRVMQPEWAERLVKAGRKYGSAVFFKQLGGIGGDGIGGELLNGRKIQEYPAKIPIEFHQKK